MTEAADEKRLNKQNKASPKPANTAKLQFKLHFITTCKNLTRINGVTAFDPCEVLPE